MNNRENLKSCDYALTYKDKNVLLFGATGFIGRWVSRFLSKKGAKVYLVVRNKDKAEKILRQYGIDGQLLQMDLASDLPDFLSLYRSVRPSITFNLAGYGIDRSERDEDTAYQINEHLLRSLCAAVSQVQDHEWAGQDIVHVGSALEYGESGGDLSEDTQENPTTLYGQSKLAGTRALTECCRAGNIKGVTVRLFTVYGPGEHEGRLLPSLVNVVRAKSRLKLTDGRQKRDFTYVEDVAEGLLCIGSARGLHGEVVNLATGKLMRVKEFIDIAADILAIPEELLDFGAIPTRIEEMEHDPVSITKLRALLGWSPTTDVNEGVCQTARFYGIPCHQTE